MRLTVIHLCVLLLLAATASPNSCAQCNDSTHCQAPHSGLNSQFSILNSHFDNHAFTWQQSVAPSVLIAGGTAISFSPLHTGIDGRLRDWLQRDGHQRNEIENGIQYIPLASTLLLKACGIESRHSWRDLVCLEAGTVLLAFTINTGLKHALDVERPYPGVYTSFPSGHTVTAFLGAEILRREYGEKYPGIAIAGYTIATGVGFMRMYNNRHWASDVLAGAGIGILSASLMYWLAPYLTF